MPRSFVAVLVIGRGMTRKVLPCWKDVFVEIAFQNVDYAPEAYARYTRE